MRKKKKKEIDIFNLIRWLVKVERLEEVRYLGTIHCCVKLPGGLIRQAEHTSKTQIPLSRARVDQAARSGKGELLVWAWFLCCPTQNHPAGRGLCGCTEQHISVQHVATLFFESLVLSLCSTPAQRASWYPGLFLIELWLSWVLVSIVLLFTAPIFIYSR